MFGAVFTGAGIEVKIPPQCPRASTYGERWVRTLRGEFTDRMLIFRQRHLRHVLAEYVKHYNHSRPHQALNLSPPRPPVTVIDLDEQRRVRRRPILGGLINEYKRTRIDPHEVAGHPGCRSFEPLHRRPLPDRVREKHPR